MWWILVPRLQYLPVFSAAAGLHTPYADENSSAASVSISSETSRAWIRSIVKEGEDMVREREVVV